MIMRVGLRGSLHWMMAPPLAPTEPEPEPEIERACEIASVHTDWAEVFARSLRFVTLSSARSGDAGIDAQCRNVNL